MISPSLGQLMRLLRSGLSVGSRSTSRNFSPADSSASSTRASSNQSNQIPPHPPAHTSTVTPSDSIMVMVLEHTGHSITRSSLASGSRVVSVIPSSLLRLPPVQAVDRMQLIPDHTYIIYITMCYRIFLTHQQGRRLE